MKNVFKVALLAAGVFSFGRIQARPMQQDTTKLTHKVGKAAKTVGNATAHTAVSGESAVVDKIYQGKCAPGGQTVYINSHSHYYYVNKKGRKIYLRKSELMDKPMK
jgi:hypothetical protein